MTDIGLKAIDGEDHPSGLRRDDPQTIDVGARQGEQFVVPIQEVADAPHADRHPTSDQLGVDLRDAAVLGMAQHTHQSDDVETELVLRQSEVPLVLRAEADAMTRALRIATTADLKPELDQAVQG